MIVSELVPYKRVDAAVRAFNQNGRRLRVVGDGPEYKALKRAAAANIEFCGRVTDEDLRELYARCRAFLMPGEEDFGISGGGSAREWQAGDRAGQRRGARNRA